MNRGEIYNSPFHHCVVARDDLRIDHFRNAKPSDTIVFTFTPRLEYDMTRPGFGVDFLLSLGLDVVAIKTSTALWYQNIRDRDVAEIRRWLSWTSQPYRRRVGYGSSMGAYAAIRFSGVLDLNFVLGFGPIFDIFGDWEPRWRDDVDTVTSYRREHGMALGGPMMDRRFIAPQCQYMMVYDPFDLDSRHVELYREIIGPKRLSLVRVPFSGHPPIGFFHEAGLLGPFAGEILQGRQYDGLPRSRRDKRAGSTRYLTNLAETCLAHRHPVQALSLTAKLLALAPDDAEAHMRACKAHHVLGQMPEARIALNRALALRHRYHAHFEAYGRRMFGDDVNPAA